MLEKRIEIFKNKHNKRQFINSNNGFTLIEVLIVIGILAILATLVLVAVNPSKQFKTARETKRSADIATIMSGISQNKADHDGKLICLGVEYPRPVERTLMGSNEGEYDIAQCLLPDYIGTIPFDSGNPSAYWNNSGEYNTGYSIVEGNDGRIIVSAPSELSESGIISITQ